MNKITTLGTIALMSMAGFAIAANTSEQMPQRHHHHAFQQSQLPRDLQALNLSDTQKAQIQKIIATAHPERLAGPNTEQESQFKQGMQAHRAAEQRLMSEKTFNEIEARRLITERQQQMQKRAQTRIEHEVKMLKMRHDVFQVLTPAQQKQLLDNQAKHRAERQMHHKQYQMGKNKAQN